MKKRFLPFLAGTLALLSAVAVPASFAAEKSAEKPVSPWAEIFPDGLVKAGQKAASAKKADALLSGKKYVGIYRARSTCSGCRKFTPQLAEFYKKNKAEIEIVLLPADKTEAEALAYAKETKMKWLAVPFGGAAKVAQGFDVPGLNVYAPDGSFFMKVYCLKPYRSDQLTLQDLRERMTEAAGKKSAKK